MTKHTPGEWTKRQAYSSGEPQEIVIQYGTEILASVHHLGNDRQEEYEANAAVMRAAPRLLAALEAMLDVQSARRHPLGAPDEGIAYKAAQAAANARDAIQAAKEEA